MLLTRPLLIATICTVTLVATGCHLLDVSGSSSGTVCPNSAVINAGAGISDFKQRIPKQTAVAPPDSTLDVALVFSSAVTQADRDAITAAGGTNVSSAGTATALHVQFLAKDLPAYIANDTGRLSEAIIYIPSCTNF